MKTFLSLSITLAPLAFGLAAWILAGLCAFWGRLLTEKKRSAFSTLSWFACAVALWFPLQAIHRWVENGDTAAILDCVGAYFLCATVLLAVNLLLNLLGALRNRKK